MFDRRSFIQTVLAAGGATAFGPIRNVNAQENVKPSEKSMSFLKEMLSSPSPSGYEQPVQKIWRTYTGQFADVHSDSHGNAIGVINPDGKPRLMLAGHCDELGFMVKYIDDDGFIYFGTIGGFDQGIIPGRRVRIHAAGGAVLGVIGKGPIHLMSEEQRNKVSQVKDLCIDIGAKDKDEAESLITIGDPITYTYDFMELRNGMVVARAFDDRIGSFMVAETLNNLSKSKKLNAAVYGVSTVQEEVGLRGATTSAFSINPKVALATDVTHATDYPGINKKEFGEVKLGGGPVIGRGPNFNPVVFELLVQTAEKNDIPYQILGYTRGSGTDANAIQLTRAGVATGLVSIPLRYMHTAVETLALSDVVNITKLMTSFAEALAPDMDFTP
ncbi:M42 family metallopeptidase [Candidatus Latescibacterota bacterium]